MPLRRRALRLAVAAAFAGSASLAAAEPVRIVAIGASNTSGWGVGEAAAYPARLEALLRANGIDATVVNAGRPFETTNGMLGRIDADVPAGTRAVVIQPGANDLRFLGTAERRARNIDEMTARLTARGIAAVLYDPVFPPEDYQWDRIHINAEGHARIARDLLPKVLEAIGPGRRAGAGKSRAEEARPAGFRPPKP